MYKHILPHKEKFRNSLINIEEEVAKLKKEKNSLREGRKKIKMVEFSTKVGGWGQQWTDFPLFLFVFWNKICT